VLGSRSKAENLMYGMEHLVPKDTSIVIIFDADHHPRPDCVSTLVRTLIAHNFSAVQGAVLVERGGPYWLRTLVDGMEWTNWTFWGPGFSVLVGSAFFGGGNAAWRKDALMSLGFDSEFLTEDIDITLRALALGHAIEVAPWAVVGELCPQSFGAFYKQRLRWALGWEQVTLTRMNLLFSSNHISEPRKWRVMFMCWMRYLTASTSMISLGSMVITTVWPWFNHGDKIDFPLPIDVCMNINTVTMGIAVASLVLIALGLTGGVREPLERWIHVGIFLPTAAAYFTFQITLMVISWCHMCCKDTHEWVPTARQAGAATLRVDAGPAHPAAKPEAEARAEAWADEKAHEKA